MKGKHHVIIETLALYFPESFEWLVLKSNILGDSGINEILSHPEDYIDSKDYLSWERFFTRLLIQKTEKDPIRRYSKSELPQFYYSGKNKTQILNVIPEEIRRLL